MLRDEALEILTRYLKDDNLLKHSYAVEAGMERFARFLGEDEKRWGLAGLLHDLDYEITKENFERHGFETIKILESIGFSDRNVLGAIVMHSGNVEPSTPMGKALYSVDPASGFIVACALMHPEKRLDLIDKPFMIRRFKEKRFAKGADRGQIRAVEENFGVDYPDFLDMVRDGMLERRELLGF